MSKNYLKLALIFAMLAVILGAFGAHALKKVLSEYQLSIYETGIRYQFYHALGMLAPFALREYISERFSKLSVVFFTLGILLFSGSLYVLACSDMIGLENKSVVGPLTPIGGVFFILGWGSLIFGIRKS